MIFSVNTHGLFFLKNKKGITVTNAFQIFSKEFNYKPNKVWVNKGSEFYSRSIKPWLEKNATEMYTTQKKRKSILLKDLLET